MKNMTIKQEKVYRFICNKIEMQGFPPTVREIGENFQISVKGAYDHLKAIERKGFIRCSSSKSRAIEIMNKIDRINHLGIDKIDKISSSMNDMLKVPLMGRTSAGVPVLAEQNIEDEYYLPKSVLGKQELFALRVNGDSMIDAGIHNGDLALIKMQSTADNGDIIVALLDDETTIKRFYNESGRIRLQPENSNYKPIYTNSVSIIGKVLWIFRKIS